MNIAGQVTLTSAAILIVPCALIAQSAPRDAFRAWARTHAHAVQLTGSGAAARDLAPLRAIAGNARIIALAEPMHIAREVLAMRNRMIQYAVTELGVRAVALETGLASSKRLYDHVLGRTTESDSALRSSFSYGFGDFPENLELIRWLRSYNAATDSSRVVRLYGIDLTGNLGASVAPAWQHVLAYLERVDPDRAGAIRDDFRDVTGNLDARRYLQLKRPQQDAVVASIQDLIAVLRRGEPSYIAATSRDEYDWALRTAINVAQEVAFNRALPPDLLDQMERGGPAAIKTSPQLLEMQATRDVAMVDNLAWILEREAAPARIFAYAHMGHFQKQVHRTGILDGGVPMGVYADSRFGTDYRLVGTYFGTGAGFPDGFRPLTPDADGIDGFLGSIGIPAFLADLRQLPPGSPLYDWFAQAHRTRTGSYGEWIGLISPSTAFDAILYIDRVTPVAPVSHARQ